MGDGHRFTNKPLWNIHIKKCDLISLIAVEVGINLEGGTFWKKLLLYGFSKNDSRDHVASNP